MNIKKCIIITSVIVVVIFSIVCIIWNNKQKDVSDIEVCDDEQIVNRGRVVHAKILIKSGNEQMADSITSSKMVNTYEELINSKSITNKVKNEFPDANKVELELIDDSDIIRVIYVCDNHSGEECKEILNKYINEFSKAVEQIYNVRCYIVDEPEITIRSFQF